jgi:hypothetical protein
MSTDALERIDLTPLSQKAKRELGWADRRCDQALRRYKAFLRKAISTERQLEMLDDDADTLWHFHILDTYRYHEDCQLLFGRYLHHVPSMDGAGYCSKCKGDVARESFPTSA